MTKPTFAQLDRTIQPSPTTLPALALPKIQRAELPNGLNIIVVEHHKLPLINMELVFNTGADADPLGKAGVANLTTSMIDEGTPKKSSLEIADAFDFLGAQFSAASNFDGSYLTLLTLKEHLDASLQIFSEVLLSPTFPDSEFQRIKDELLTSLSQQKDRASSVAATVFSKMLFGEQHPYGFQVAGIETTVRTISVEDTKKFYETYYAPNNATLIVVGDITKKEVVQFAEKYFGKWKKKNIPAPKISSAKNIEETAIYLVDKPDAPQSEIRLGQIGAPRTTKDYFTLSLLQHILGSSSGRLFLNLREEKGYTYGAYANFAFRKNAGPFVASAAVKSEVTDSALIEFLYEINRMREESVADSEFQMYKTAVIQRLPRTFETAAQITDNLATLALFGFPDSYFNDYVKHLSAITQEDVLAAGKKYLIPPQLVIVVVGDKAKIQQPLENLRIGKIIPCDANGNILK